MTINTTLPLNALSIDPMNVRSVGRGQDDPELKASIKTNGVKLPLIVRPGGAGYMAYVGGRRLEALQALAAEGAIAADYPVPVIIEDVSDVQARQISLTENVIRRAMHPVDEYRAFASLQEDPATPLDVAQIAERFGLSLRHVEQRLALGKLHPKVLDAWRDGQFGQEVAQAFTLCVDPKKQAKLLKVLDERGGASVHAIKAELKLGRDNAGRLLEVIGREAYEARGGKVVVDLFGTDHQVSDPGLIRDMLQERVDATVRRLLADGWSWVVVGRPDDWHLHGDVRPKLKPTEAEAKQIEQFRKECEDESLSWEDQRAAEEALNILCDAVELRSYGPRQKAQAGCFVVLEDDGEVVVHHGKIKPEPVAAKKAAKAKGAGVGAKAEAGLSKALRERLEVQLAWATQDAILADKHPTELAALNAKVVAGLIEPQRPWGMPKTLQKAVGKIRDAVTPKVMLEALRKRFDAEDYFKSAPVALCLAAVTEACGADEARKLTGKKRADLAKWCVANVAKKGWLPVELRTGAYGGPVDKKKAA